MPHSFAGPEILIILGIIAMYAVIGILLLTAGMIAWSWIARHTPIGKLARSRADIAIEQMQVENRLELDDLHEKLDELQSRLDAGDHGATPPQRLDR